MGRPKFKVCKEVPREGLEGSEPAEGRVEGGEGPQTAWNLQVEGGDGPIAAHLAGKNKILHHIFEIT